MLWLQLVGDLSLLLFLLLPFQLVLFGYVGLLLRRRELGVSSSSSKPLIAHRKPAALAWPLLIAGAS